MFTSKLWDVLKVALLAAVAALWEHMAQSNKSDNQDPF
jgi:hypothetical protein